MATKRKLTDDEREQRRAQDRERLKHAAEQLLTSEGWRRWIRVRSQAGLARLSLSNQLLVAMARPDATFVAGFKAWLNLGYCVKKGEKAIRIIAPMPVKERDRDSGEETGETLTLFKGVSVFDRAQVAPLPSGEPAPLEPPCEPLTGDSHAHLLEPLIAHATQLGYAVEIRDLPGGGPDGWCDPDRKQIVVATGPANRQVRTLVHELAHAHGLGYAEFGRERCEVLVDCVTYCVLGCVGLDVGGESIPYVAGWGEGGALDAIRQYAETIDSVARRIERALGRRANPAVDTIRSYMSAA